MPLNLANAAASILKAIKGGNIVGAKYEHGERHAEGAEHPGWPPATERSAGHETGRRDAAPDAADIEAEIEALIRQAGDRLRQQADEAHRDHDDGSDPEQSRLLEDPRRRRPWWWRIVGYRRAN